MSRAPKIVVVGSSNIDLVCRSSRLPKPGETLIGSSFETVSGGKGANQAVAAARLGADVWFVGRVGADAFGEMARTSLESSGVHTDFLFTDASSSTGVALISVDAATGENSIIVVPGANALVSAADVAKASDAIASADAVICSLEIPLETVEAAASIAEEFGVKVVINPAPAMALPDRLIRSAAALTPNEHEAAIVSGIPGASPTDAARFLINRGAKCVVVTLGSNGAAALVAGEPIAEYFSPSAPVASVVDTTAAGDCFTAALTVAISEGRGWDDALHFANATAGLTITKAGAQSSLPTRAVVEEFLSTFHA